jgi:urease accessory protein
MPVRPAEPPAARWRAELDLEFEADKTAAKTRLIRRRQFGPLAVQRPFYPEKDGACHVYLLHPPAGIAGGDELHQSFRLAAEARCVLTTPGAARFYRSPSGRGLLRTSIEVGAGAVCEYLPQEVILFDAANAHIQTRITLRDDALFVGWDFICFGRPAAEEKFAAGSLNQHVEIAQGNELVWFERFALDGGSELLTAPFAFAGQPVFGTMVCAGALRAGLADAVRDAVGACAASRFSVSQLDRVVVCRYLGAQAEEGRQLFVLAWNVLRLQLQSKPACLPRIWAT